MPEEARDPILRSALAYVNCRMKRLLIAVTVPVLEPSPMAEGCVRGKRRLPEQNAVAGSRRSEFRERLLSHADSENARS